MPIDPRNYYYPDDCVRDPAAHAALVTPNDNADLERASRALLIGNAGDLAVTTVGGETLTLPVSGGMILPLMVVRVHATGTSATPIVALW